MESSLSMYFSALGSGASCASCRCIPFVAFYARNDIRPCRDRFTNWSNTSVGISVAHTTLLRVCPWPGRHLFHRVHTQLYNPRAGNESQGREFRDSLRTASSKQTYQTVIMYRIWNIYGKEALSAPKSTKLTPPSSQSSPPSAL